VDGRKSTEAVFFFILFPGKIKFIQFILNFRCIKIISPLFPFSALSAIQNTSISPGNGSFHPYNPLLQAIHS